ncbi:glutaminase A [Pseudoclavibacter sp. CFCC 13611]|uniref:glutaminase A n=1 Tax=Pseudoclavibacter sp. CFCC 13611 TaxID=2615178 RepID=UPI001300F024|nr:glutaminase A [Pseudoclavibacter sp. CFCC 13611]KAB1663076.1 glutaminase A [Pseudoclavibacter sp. CFCC 13611]
MITSESQTVDQQVSTGHLPGQAEVASLTTTTYERCRQLDDGRVADYIPALAEADPTLFGLSVSEVNGATHDAGDSDYSFSIQSVSKAFVYALVCEAYGHAVVKERVGVDNTGLPFNSVMALELNGGHPMNPMVNAGAIATTAMMPGATPAEQWELIRTGLSTFAGRQLTMDGEVYASEMKTNSRNKGIARLLESYGRLDHDPLDMVDIYTRQCAMLVTSHDLSVMGATLADGGMNPVTGEQVVSAEVCRDTLSVLAASGMYERSGEWLFEIGIPAKSGVAGGIVAIAPGKGSIGTFSPRLNSAGNSVRGQRAIAYLSRALGLNLFASDSKRQTGKVA